MKYLCRLCLVATLIFTFAFSAAAGEIECPGIIESSARTTAAVEMPNGVELSDSATEMMLSLLEIVLSLA